MSRHVPSSRFVHLAFLFAALGVLAACPKPQPATNALAATQTAARLPVEEQLSMPALDQGSPVEPGIVEVTVVRSADALGRFSGSLPREVDLGKSMLLYLGRDRDFRSIRDKAGKMIVVDAPARDIYSPGVTVTSSEMHTVVSLLFDRPTNCGGAALGSATVVEPTAAPAEPAGDDASTDAKGTREKMPGLPGTPEHPANDEKPARDPAKAQLSQDISAVQGVSDADTATSDGALVLYVVPALPDPLQVSVERLPCPKP